MTYRCNRPAARRFLSLLGPSLVVAIVVAAISASAHGASGDARPREKQPAVEQATNSPVADDGGSDSAETPAASGPRPASSLGRPGRIPFADLTKDAKPVEGLIHLYRKDDRLLADLTPSLLNRDFIVLISIARGLGENPIFAGMYWGSGDDWLWQFRKVEEKIQVVRRNVRFTAAKGSPEEKAVHLAYTDSVLFSLPIISTSPGGGSVVELGNVFMSDLPQIANALPGFMFARDRSSWASVKGFANNVELEVAATYASPGRRQMDAVPDSRGATINIHYSISVLPQTGYQARLADDRVGHFPTVIKDYSKKYETDRFVRYVNRWDLRKADPAAELSPPKKPIVFWLEKTIPFEYRKPIREGILEWNKAFEKIGFANAIEVRQQPDDADWDPEDINYNTFRWITAGAGFAMGPSRVNPITGEILDADIIFDSDFLSHWKDEFDVLRVKPGTKTAAPAAASAAAGFEEEMERIGGVFPAPPGNEGLPARWLVSGGEGHCRGVCEVTRGMASQLALGSVAIQASGKPVPQEEFRKMVMQAVKEVAMHETGHTLGLRHNFKASSIASLEEMNAPERIGNSCLGGSVMDYIPTNLMPKGYKQGDYFSTTIGPYDYWAIEYAYKPLTGGTEGEAAELKKIAARSGERALQYATDEDTRGIDPDPLVNRYDLGKDPVAFAKTRKELVSQLLPTLMDRVTETGDGYQRTRRAFNMLLQTQETAMQFVAREIGGVYVNRSHKGDKDAKPPFVIVEPAKQREALAFLQENVFGEKSFEFPPELYNLLTDTHWSHWGIREPLRQDYPVRDTMLVWQDRMLSYLLSEVVLSRLGDSEVKVPADQDAFTVAELLAGLSTAVFRELDKIQQGEFTARKPAISPLRRDSQRLYLEYLGNLAVGNLSTTDDCQTLVFVQLEGIEARINAVLLGKAKLDPYTQAHLKESSARIHKILDARLQLRGP